MSNEDAVTQDPFAVIVMRGDITKKNNILCTDISSCCIDVTSPMLSTLALPLIHWRQRLLHQYSVLQRCSPMPSLTNGRLTSNLLMLSMTKPQRTMLRLQRTSPRWMMNFRDSDNLDDTLWNLLLCCSALCWVAPFWLWWWVLSLLHVTFVALPC